MKILITSPNEFAGDTLAVGKYYYAEPADTGTNEQNKTFHALLQAYYTSGAHSYPAESFNEFKKHIKKSLGAGYESYVYIEYLENGRLLRGQVQTKSELPKNIAVDANGQKMVYGILKSWHDYTKKERTETIDRLIAEMLQAGVNSNKFHEILRSMEENSLTKSA